ncbi:PP2C family protein-serine/threonine phosphatase [Kitasatospora sp. NPDC058965]|uniref:PP2C family protein-serine/threonine phosphatase n=1 Tax=Kitasatospora sp. NPDC058965 TaxID=3346682 RepID=UPI0036C5CA61
MAAAVLVAGAIAYGAFRLDARHAEAMSRLAGQWRVVDNATGRFRTAAGDVRAACLAGGPQQAVLLPEAGQRLLAETSTLRQATAGSAELAGPATALETAAAQWWQAVRSGQAGDPVRLCALPSGAVAEDGPAAGAGLAPGAIDYATVDAAASRFRSVLQSLVTDDAHAARTYAFASLLYVLAVCVGLLIVAGAGAVVVMRRFVLPVSQIAGQLTRAGRLPTDPAPAAPRGWIAGLEHASAQVRSTLETTRRKERRGTEALAQVGPAVQGLREILTARDRPGPGVLVTGDVRAAEGLIAGDYLGVLPMPDGATALFLGDVAGHGVDAGLLAVRLKTVLVVALRLGRDLDNSVHAVWQALAGEQERFTTLTVAVLDPVGATLTWVNAGHEPPFLRRADGTVDRLEVTGPIVHPFLVPEPGTWQAAVTELHPGDLLLLSTDGLTEGRGPDGEEFGDRRVTEVLAALPATPTPAAAVAALYTAADRFGIDWARDDVSLLAATPADPSGPSDPSDPSDASDPSAPGSPSSPASGWPTA